ncbi:MAG: hypothetical protein JRH20_07855 [Deltaproteobacteria bacterium]|nr:hypothetical protein [Deltaproteobacteria bacterium]
MSRVTFGFTLALVALGSCKERLPPSPRVTASDLPAIRISESREKLLFTYRDVDTSFQTVTKLKEVPEASRAWVRVVDLGMKPGKRRDHRLVYVADLRKSAKDGSYPYLVVSRRAFETAATAKNEEQTAAMVAEGKGVVLYSTTWCPACRSARSWLKEKKIPFVEKDIEKDKRAAAELMAKAQKAGVSPSGVPVIDVNGTLVQGFDAARITALLGGNG